MALLKLRTNTQNDFNNNFERINLNSSDHNSIKEDEFDLNSVDLRKPGKNLIGKCRICNDKSSGLHYGVVTCEGCKGFFKRCLIKKETYICPFKGKCEITSKTRNDCKACRMRKCIEAGMSLNEKNLTSNEKNDFKDKSDDSDSSDSSQSNLDTPSSLTPSYYLSIKDRIINIKKIMKSPIIYSNSHITQYFINSNNEDYLIFISLLKDKIYQLFMENKEKLILPIKARTEIIKKQVNEMDSSQVTMSVFLTALINSFSRFARDLVKFAKLIPGLDVLDDEDLGSIVKDQVYFLHAMKYVNFFIDEECYALLNGEVHVNRFWFNVVRGKQSTDLIFNFFRVFNEMRLTDKELALFYPFILCSPDIKINDQETLNNLTVYYTRALIYELELNGRDTNFMNIIIELMKIAGEIKSLRMRRMIEGV